MLLIKNANLDGTGKIVDILIGDDGKYQEIAEHIEGPAGVETIDATGKMACPTFVNTHMHFDKAYTSYEQGRQSFGKKNWISSTEETLEDSIFVMHERIRKYTPEDVAARATRAIRECVMYGTTKLRSNIDISTLDPELNAVKGLLIAKEATKDICDLQLVAFPQEGLICDPGAEKLMERAMDMGCDVVGGMPAAEMLDEHSREHVDICFKMAEKYGALMDMHIDQSKDMFDRSLEYTAWLTMQRGWQGRVTGGHCTSIAYQNQAHAIKVMKMLKKADVNVCANTQTLAIMGIDQEPRTRGVTRIREMVDMGINVVTAQDTICDGFHLYGTGDPLDYGLVGCYCAQYNTPETARIMWEMITSRSARVFDPDAKYGIAVGNDADLNIIEAPNVHDAIRIRASRPYVIRHGKVIASFKREATLL
jgi:cytosine deaminase